MNDVAVDYELQDSTVARAALSERQLFERVVEFWSDHFNIYAWKPWQWTLLTPFVRDVYLATGGDIRAMLRAILRRAHVEAATPQFKRPFQMMARSLRALNAQFTGIYGYHRLQRFAAAGHAPFQYLMPDGPPNTFLYWGASLLPRSNFAFEALQGTIDDTIVNIQFTFAGAVTAPECVQRINQHFFLGSMSEYEVHRCCHYLSIHSTDPVRRLETIALAGPTWQWYWPWEPNPWAPAVAPHLRGASGCALRWRPPRRAGCRRSRGA